MGERSECWRSEFSLLSVVFLETPAPFTAGCVPGSEQIPKAYDPFPHAQQLLLWTSETSLDFTREVGRTLPGRL